MSDWVSEHGVRPSFCTDPEHKATIADLRSQLEALQRSATQIEDLKTKLEDTRSQRDSYKDEAEELEAQLEAAQLEAAQWASQPEENDVPSP